MISAALHGNLDNLAAAAINEKTVLEEFVKNLNTLTTSNKEMAAAIKNLMGNKIQM